MLDGSKQILRSFYQNHMCSILQSLIFVEKSEKLLRGVLAKHQTHSLGIHYPSIFQEELLSSAEHYDLVLNCIGV